MPSMKMKTKSTTRNVKEKIGLRVWQTAMISKSSSSHIRISQHEAELGTLSRIKQEISFCNNVLSPDAKNDDADCYELLNGEKVPILRQRSLSNDLEADVRMISGPAQPSCISKLETIFSPILQVIGHRNKVKVLSAEGSKDDLEALSLGGYENDDNDKNLCEYQTCNVSDFYISDMIFSEIPIKGCIYDFNETASLPDYKYDKPSVILEEKLTLMPFLEDSLGTSNSYGCRLCKDTMSNSIDSGLCISIHRLQSYDQESDAKAEQNWDQTDYLDIDLFIMTLKDVSDVNTNPWPTNLLRNGSKKKRSTTLVLDLDETLVHSTVDHCTDADFTFPVYVDMKEHIVYVKKRPFLHTFLERVADMFEIVIFTASQSIYAKQILDTLDPDQKIILRRAYRESCIFADGCYTKDLIVLGVDLAKIAIIDNSPQVFRFQVNNGIPIESWFDDPSDCALITLLPFLETLVDVEDVRPIIAEKFSKKEY